MSRQPPRGDYGIIGPAILVFFAVALLGFWPVMVVHGQTGTGGWRWDIHSTYAELAYLGTIAFVIVLIWLGNRPAKTAAPKPRRERSWPPPKYVPPQSPGPDPAVTMRLLAGLDAIDGYVAEAEKARTGEELDYLNVYGRLPGQERGPR